MPKRKETKLKINEAYVRDAGRNVARIDYDTMYAIDAETGNCIMIDGERATYAKALPLYPSDEDKKIIRIDSLVRRNASLNVGSSVSISKASYKPAESITIKRTYTTPTVDERFIAGELESFFVTRGDLVMVPYLGGYLEFNVAAYTPECEVVQITQNTDFRILTRKDKNVTEHIGRLYEDLIASGYKVKPTRERFVMDLAKIVESNVEREPAS